MRRTKGKRRSLALMGLIWLVSSLPGEVTEVVASDAAPASEVDVAADWPGGHALSMEAKGSVVPAPGISDPEQAASASKGTPGLETYQDIPVGFTEEGHPFMGDPKASVILEEYSDYLYPTAAKGSVAALCVAEQGAALFWAMHDELFRVQRQWSRLPDPTEFLAGASIIVWPMVEISRRMC